VSWEEASGYLHARDFRREEVVHLWLQFCYVLGTHVLVGLAVTIQGYRRIAGVIESTPQDQERIEGFLYDLDARGLSADRGLLCTVPGGVALPNAVRTVWGTRVALQRCLNTTMVEVVNGLAEVDARRFRHRLQHAWRTCDAAEAQQALEEIARDLDQKNRSVARVLRQHMDQTVTLQQTGMLPQTDRGLRVLSYLNTLMSRVRPVIPAGPAHQRVPRLCAGLLELEPQLRRVAHATYLPALRKSLTILHAN
jgi:transposase-like protein